MSESANVRSVQTLSDLRNTLGRFAETTIPNLTRAEIKMQEWILPWQIYRRRR